MTNEIPDEIRALRQRLAQLEALAESSTSGFNQAVRAASRRGRIEAEPVPTAPEPAPEEVPDGSPTRGVQGGPLKPDDFNTVLRRLRGFPTE